MIGNPELWRRIETFDIDGGDRPAVTFAARLADENEWSRAFAERVIAEYKRYVYLAMTHGSPVCPSDQVDEAWHLHLTYTRSYWQRFCKEALRGELHHDPTRGGGDEDNKHWQMYEDTLAAYRATFGAEPPSDIWPSTAKRFPGMKPERSSAMALLSVNPIAIIAAVAMAIAGWTLAGSGDPFALKGGSFFLVLLPAMLLAIVGGRYVYDWVRLRGSAPLRRFGPLDWDEAAYVAGRSGRLSSAAMARLVASGYIRVSDDRKELLRTGKDASGVTEVEEAVLRHMPIAKGSSRAGQKFKAMEVDIERAFRKKKNALEAQGVTIPERQLFVAWLWALVPFALVMIFLAAPRLASGLATNKPVFFLVLAMIIGTIVCLVSVRPTLHNHRTRKGDEILERLRTEHKPLENGAGIDKSSGMALGTAAGLGVALFGMSAVANSDVAALSDLDVFLPTRQSQTSGCGGGCGGGTSGGGGGDSGGGGCSGCGGGGGD